MLNRIGVIATVHPLPTVRTSGARLALAFPECDDALTGRRRIPGEPVMLDLVFVVVTAAFFAISIAYARGCDRL
jgi:hypothetical protein